VLIRPATPGDLPALAAAADAVFRTPPRPGLDSMARNYPLLFAAGNAGNLWLAVEPGTGRIVAHAGYTLRPALLQGQAAQVACFGAVFTAADQRGRGLATQVFRAAVDRARAAGAELGLVSGARGLYERAGFVPYPLCRRYRVSAGVPATTPIVLSPYTPALLDDLVRLHAAEPTRLLRSRADWQALVSAGVVLHYPGRLFAISRPPADGPVAYVAVALPAVPVGDRGPRVLELAGDRRAIADAAPAMAQALNLPTIDLILPPQDDSLGDQAGQPGWAADLTAPVSCTFQRWNPALSQVPLPFYGLDYV
jgi:predicted N-acetyltransferase YhbS